MLKNIFILTTIFLIVFAGISEADIEEKQCWRGTLNIDSQLKYKESKPKKERLGHGEETLEIIKDIRVDVNFYIGPRGDTEILGKDIYGSYTYNSEITLGKPILSLLCLP